MTAWLQVQVAEAPVIQLLAEVLHANLKNGPEVNICSSISFNLFGVLLLFNMGLVGEIKHDTPDYLFNH